MQSCRLQHIDGMVFFSIFQALPYWLQKQTVPAHALVFSAAFLCAIAGAGLSVLLIITLTMGIRIFGSTAAAR